LKKTSIILLTALLMLTAILLSACGNNQNGDEPEPLGYMETGDPIVGIINEFGIGGMNIVNLIDSIQVELVEEDPFTITNTEQIEALIGQINTVELTPVRLNRRPTERDLTARLVIRVQEMLTVSIRFYGDIIAYDGDYHVSNPSAGEIIEFVRELGA